MRLSGGPERVCLEKPPEGWSPPPPVGFVSAGETVYVQEEPTMADAALPEVLTWDGDDS